MKKIVCCIAPLLIVLMGCASRGTAVAETNNSPPGMDLDTAIREAAAQMEAKISSKTMVALVSVASPSTAFSTQVLTRLESAIVSSGKLVVVDRANLDKVREEQGFHLSGEVDDESAKSIGKLLGAGAIVTGSLADLGDIYSLTLKAINIETATVAVSYLADLAKSARIETLLASGGGAASGGPGTRARTAQGGGNAAPASVPVSAPVLVPVPAPEPAPEPVQRNPNDPYKIGDRGPAGGWIFYDKGGVSNGWRYLEAAPANAEFTAEWGAYGVTVGGTVTALGYGKRNTETILNYLRSKEEIGRAAQICDELFAGGYEDWFLPSKDELNLMYTNLKMKGVGGFGNGLYWSSSESSGNYYYAWYQDFKDGKQTDYTYDSNHYKNRVNSVRAARQF